MAGASTTEERQPLAPSADTPPSGPAAEVAPSPPAEKPEAAPGPEAAPSEGEPEAPGTEVEPPTPAWAKTASLEELFDLGEVKSRLEERDKGVLERGQQEGAKETQRRLQPILQKHEAHLASINKGLGEFVTSWNRLAKNGALDKDAIEELIEGHETTFNALRGVYAEQGHWGGVDGTIAEMLNSAGVSDRHPEFQQRLDNLRNGLSDPTVVGDLLDVLVEAKLKQERERWEKEEGKQVAERVEATIRAEKRSAEKPPAEPKGGGAGGRGAGKYTNLNEARNAHAKGEIDNAEMRRAKLRFRQGE